MKLLEIKCDLGITTQIKGKYVKSQLGMITVEISDMPSDKRKDTYSNIFDELSKAVEGQLAAL